MIGCILVLFLAAVCFVINFPVFQRPAQTYSGENTGLCGVWAYGDHTRYEFDEDGSGTMILDDWEFPYQYTTDENQLYMNFESDSLRDAVYTYLLEGKQLTLTGGEGTTGGTYQLTKEK